MSVEIIIAISLGIILSLVTVWTIRLIWLPLSENCPLENSEPFVA